MSEFKTDVESIYAMLSTLQVSGDAVDVIAAVRAKLRKFRDMADRLEELETGLDG